MMLRVMRLEENRMQRRHRHLLTLATAMLAEGEIKLRSVLAVETFAKMRAARAHLETLTILLATVALLTIAALTVDHL